MDSEDSEPGGSLRRAISGRLLFLFVLGDVLGAGIYALVGEVAGEVGGAIWLPMLVALALALLTASSYAELVTKYPQAGGSAVYAERAYRSPLVSFLVGYCMLAAGVVSAAGLAHAFSGEYLTAFVDLPPNLGAALFLLAIGALNARGIRESMRANVAMTFIELTGLLLVVVAAAYLLSEGGGDAGRALEVSGDGPVIPAVFAGAILAFYSFVGFETTANVAEEIEDPSRVYPRALFGAIVTAGLIYVVVGSAAAMTVAPTELAESTGPLLAVVDASGLEIPDRAFSAIALVAVANGALLTMIMSSRLTFGMARQHLLPRSLGTVLPTRRTPGAAIAVTTAVAVVLTFTGNLATLAETVVLLLLFVFLSEHQRRGPGAATGRGPARSLPRLARAPGPGDGVLLGPADPAGRRRLASGRRDRCGGVRPLRVEPDRAAVPGAPRSGGSGAGGRRPPRGCRPLTGFRRHQPGTPLKVKALTFHGNQDVRVDQVEDPRIEQPTDAVIKVTSTAICGSDLHLYGVLGMFIDEGDVLGHEPMGIVEEVGGEVTGIAPGDRVVVPFNISCGHCWMCERQLYAQCETTQNRDHDKGASLFGYTKLYGQVPGGQAEYLRVPQAQFGPIKVPEDGPDDRYLFLSDVLPTAWQAVEYAAVPPGGSLAVFGLGPIGQMCGRIALQRGAGRVFGVDNVPERLEMAGRHGVEPVNHDDHEDVSSALRELTDGRGPDSVIDAVGMEAHGARGAELMQKATALLPDAVAAPLTEKAAVDRLSALLACIDAVRRGGTVSISGVYGGQLDPLPMMQIFDKGLQVRMGQAHVRRWTDDILPLLEDQAGDPLGVQDLTTHRWPLERAPEAYEMFQKKQDGAIKVVLEP